MRYGFHLAERVIGLLAVLVLTMTSAEAQVGPDQRTP